MLLLLVQHRNRHGATMSYERMKQSEQGSKQAEQHATGPDLTTKRRTRGKGRNMEVNSKVTQGSLTKRHIKRVAALGCSLPGSP